MFYAGSDLFSDKIDYDQISVVADQPREFFIFIHFILFLFSFFIFGIFVQ
jgi:hypothetical protein